MENKAGKQGVVFRSLMKFHFARRLEFGEVVIARRLLALLELVPRSRRSAAVG